MKSIVPFVVYAVAASYLAFAGCKAKEIKSVPAAEQEARDALDIFRAANPGVDPLIDRAYGYAIFPNVGKGALIVGGGSGSGYLYEQGVLVGSVRVSMLSVGGQIGGEGYRELVLFENKAKFDALKSGEIEFGPSVRAVALKKETRQDLEFDDGLAVLTMTKGGLMAEAAVGGQKFSFRPL